MRRLRSIRDKAKEFEEERGLQTLYVAVGFASWPAPDGGRSALAPIALVPARIVDDPRVRGDLAVRRADEGEAVLNHSLMTTAPDVVRAALGDLFSEGIDDPTVVTLTLRQRLGSDPSITISDDTALGIFNFAYLAMIEDLGGAQDLMAESPLARALAGDPDSQADLRKLVDDTEVVDIEALDEIDPAHEPFVLDADPWQARAIHTVIRGRGHVVVDGPPGTGKSQTIANLIGALIAEGQTVLFVAEKRAALDVVSKRLRDAGLGELVLDLHGSNVTRKRVYAQLRRAQQKIADVGPVTSSHASEIIELRGCLNDHRRFMHSPTPMCGLSPYELLTERAALRLPSVDLRFSAVELVKLSHDRVVECRRHLDDAAESADLFLRNPSVPWACSSLSSDALPSELERLRAATQTISNVHRAMVELQIVASGRQEFESRAKTLREVATALAVVRPTIIDLPSEVLDDAIRSTASATGSLLARFSARRRRAVRAVKDQLVTAGRRPALHAALVTLRRLEPILQHVPRTLNDRDAKQLREEDMSKAWGEAERIVGRALPDDISVAINWLRRHVDDRNAAYRTAHLRAVERNLQQDGVWAFLDEIRDRGVDPPLWAPLLEATWLDSHLDILRPQFVAFSGRLHNRRVQLFADLEQSEMGVSAQRILRSVAERRITVSEDHRDQVGGLKSELDRARPKKSFRDVATLYPNALKSIAPCVMASPLTVSQFLPRATLFDVVIFDEASQVTPSIALASIIRGKRLVVAGDDKQLPPTSFFGRVGDVDEEEDEEETIGGFESILTAVRSYTTRMRLRVHYRSLDEHLIAFSNKWFYDNELLTLPGAFGDDYGVRHDLVSPDEGDPDADSPTAEVRRVVELAIEHAERRHTESLGIIALGIKHARRIELALDAALRERDDLDAFFRDNGGASFFVKNLERVQGDERDAIILTIGYGRTISGNVSHNFGPVNQAGGERRLNVAVTRSKMRLRTVSSFGEDELKPQLLASTGATLLAKYLGYSASCGLDLGDRGGEEVPLNAFEAEICDALVKRLGLSIIPQYGVGEFRIDLAVQHPAHPGRFVLAIECDGAAYHSSPTARMRDRMRQRLLEDRGWHFCRIWSTDWFNDSEAEIQRVGEAYRRAILEERVSTPETERIVPRSEAAPSRPRPRPALPTFFSVAEITEHDLHRMLEWIASDGRLRTNEELFEELFKALKFKRRGERITTRLMDAIRTFAVKHTPQ